MNSLHNPQSEIMLQPFELRTERLLLRQWQPDDFKSFAEMNADPEVMRCFPSRLTRFESDALARRCLELIAKNGWGLWAAEIIDSTEFIGFVGLHGNNSLPFPPCTEVGWRLKRSAWGQGYATEAARACLRFAFETMMLDEVVSFTSVCNRRSQGVMQRLQMWDSSQNFRHPDIPQHHLLSEHVLYKITYERWQHSCNSL